MILRESADFSLQLFNFFTLFPGSLASQLKVFLSQLKLLFFKLQFLVFRLLTLLHFIE